MKQKFVFLLLIIFGATLSASAASSNGCPYPNFSGSLNSGVDWTVTGTNNGEMDIIYAGSDSTVSGGVMMMCDLSRGFVSFYMPKMSNGLAYSCAGTYSPNGANTVNLECAVTDTGKITPDGSVNSISGNFVKTISSR